jgi:hypothetical protein
VTWQSLSSVQWADGAGSVRSILPMVKHDRESKIKDGVSCGSWRMVVVTFKKKWKLAIDEIASNTKT